ncbi:MAG: SDR family oxidoreductase [Armatimonadota bacterium]|nr:SDR family oxidoreductase [Armatimonadota bacterium]
MFRLDGGRVLVTGGTSGIGKATARIMLQAGARVVIAARGAQRGAEVARRLGTHGEVHFLAADVRVEEAVRRLMVSTAGILGGLDILVNNAGAISRVPVHELATEEWRGILEANLTSVFLCSREALPHLRSSRGAIVNVASYLAFHAGTALTPAYNAAKAGVVALTRTMAVAYGPDGVRVNAVCPAFVPTDLNRELWEVYTREQWEQAARSYPLRRVGTPEDVAYAVLFLASREAGWITGVTLMVDGGLTAR